MAYRVTQIAGDGIGPEVMQATARILEAAGVAIEWERCEAGALAYEKYHEYMPEGTDRVDGAHACGAEGSGDHPDRRRLPEHQRSPAQKV